VNLERLVKRLQPTQTFGEGVQDTRITADGVFIEDSIMAEPDVVGKTLNDDFICPDGT
jgi:hypothetical protein